MSYDLVKYISEFASSSLSMSLIDYLVYSQSMNQDLYSGILFGTSVTGSCYLFDMLIHMNTLQNIAKPILATIIYMWMY